jgi:hypothetical protein
MPQASNSKKQKAPFAALKAPAQVAVAWPPPSLPSSHLPQRKRGREKQRWHPRDWLDNAENKGGESEASNR